MKKRLLALSLALYLPFMVFANNTESININTASAQELQSLKGIGPTKAQAIVDFRDANGPFKTADELIEVPGIGVKLLEQNQERLTLN
ncbi:helix-hairpin-helix domain-containing protein [Pseudomonas sp. F1_0610]|uniref:ComEA family DNA-binding protein n=1 Tax=Pseudomonas sp. F1_0610 TaxID=3114284 RepID=UPI0039C1531F